MLCPPWNATVLQSMTPSLHGLFSKLKQIHLHASEHKKNCAGPGHRSSWSCVLPPTLALHLSLGSPQVGKKGILFSHQCSLVIQNLKIVHRHCD